MLILKQYKEFKIKKRAAMFGLDARIALAIFGALSVISGAALYSAIQNVQIVKMHNSLLEFGKSWEAYRLDVRKDVSTHSSYFYLYNVNDLVTDPGLAGWTGPYYPSKKYASDNTYLIFPENTNYRIGLRKYLGPRSGGVCASGTKCYAWITVGTPIANYDENLMLALDKRIDGSDGKLAGDFQWWQDTGNSFFYFWLKYMAIENPKD